MEFQDSSLGLMSLQMIYSSAAKPHPNELRSLAKPPRLLCTPTISSNTISNIFLSLVLIWCILVMLMLADKRSKWVLI